MLSGYVFEPSSKRVLTKKMSWVLRSTQPKWVPRNILGNNGGWQDIDSITNQVLISEDKYGANIIYQICPMLWKDTLLYCELTLATNTPITAVASSGAELPAAMKVAPATSV